MDAVGNAVTGTFDKTKEVVGKVVDMPVNVAEKGMDMGKGGIDGATDMTREGVDTTKGVAQSPFDWMSDFFNNLCSGFK